MTPPDLWAAVHRLVAPYAGELPYAIRADLFFHLSLAGSDPKRFHLKNLFFPVLVLKRMFAPAPRPGPLCDRRGELMLVSDYAAEAGIGTFRPLLKSSPLPLALAMNHQVWLRSASEVLGHSSLALILMDSGFNAGELFEAERQARKWRRTLAAKAEPGLRCLLQPASLVLKTLLLRAALYRVRFQRLFDERIPSCVVTHNDFTSLSYLAGDTARRYGIPDITMQHGTPTLEYFPTTASRYFTWGDAFRAFMEARAGRTQTKFEVAGAPRLDRLSASSSLQPVGERTMRLLFLSQMHSPLLSMQDRESTVRLIREIASNSEFNLAIRPHPQERGFWNAMIHIDPLIRITPVSHSLPTDVLESDAVMSLSSTAMLESALLGRPVLQLDMNSQVNIEQVLQFPFRAGNARDAVASLNSIRSTAGMERWLERQGQTLAGFVRNPGSGTSTFWATLATSVPELQSELVPTFANSQA